MTYDLTGKALYPLSDLLTEAEFPLAEYLPREAIEKVFGELYYTDAEAYSTTDGFHLNLRLAFEGELALSPPGLPGLALVAGGAGVDWTSLQVEFVIGPEPLAALNNVPLTLRVDGSVLKPMLSEKEVDESKPGVDISLGTISVMITTEGFFADVDIAASIPLSMVGESGVLIEANNVRPILSPPDVPPAGLDASFRGVFIESARVHLPEGLPDLVPEDLVLRNCAIGSGGVSGLLTADYSLSPPTYDKVTKLFTGKGAGKLFGIPFGLTDAEIEFKQNAFKESKITGELVLPFFDKRLGVEIGLSLDGGFLVKLTKAIEQDDSYNATTGLLTLTKPGLLSITVDTLGFQVQDGIFTVKLSGEITPLFGKMDWPSFHVNELAIDSQGNVRLDGGWIDLSEQKPLNFYGFQVEITRLGFGQTEDGGKWIGFSGGVKLTRALPPGASVEGLRIVWYDGHPEKTRLTFNGVGVEFEVPNVLKFKGAVAYSGLLENTIAGFTEKEKVYRFDGDIKLKLITLDMEIDATLVIGSASGPRGDYTFFAIYLGVELPAGIPLFGTGLALYGMAGLFATQMEPNKGALPHPTDEGWYENPDSGNGWYKRGTPGVTDLKTKWDPHPGSLAFGVGATIGTVPDNGTSFHGKFLLVIVFPGPIVLLEGRGNLLKKRADPDKPGVTTVVDEPLFRALAVLDNRAGTFTVGLDAQYKYNEDGDLLDIHGGVEAFFDFHDADAWHIYLGRKDPRAKRIQAWFFKKLFEANAYFMLQGKNPFLQTGAWVGYAIGWDFGPVAVRVEAFIEGEAVVSLKPTHFHGELTLHGGVTVSVFGLGFALSVDAHCAADVFDPFHLLFDFHVAVDLPWPLPDFAADATVEWGPEPVPPPLALPLKEIAIEHLKVTTSWPLPRAGNQPLLLPDYDNGDGFLIDPLPAFNANAAAPSYAPVVPLDSRPHITFGRAVSDDAQVGINLQPAQPEWEPIGDAAGPVRARYSLQEVELAKYVGGTGNPWVRVAWAPNSDNKTKLHGSWAPVPGGSESAAQVKLWLWSENPFDYTRHGGRAWDEWFTSQFPNYPCVPPAPDQEICCELAGVDPSKLTPPTWRCSKHPEIEVSWIAPGGSFNPNEMTITLPRGAKRVKLTPSTKSEGHLRRCVNFRIYPRGTGPNPRTERGARFETFIRDPLGALIRTTNTTIAAAGGTGELGLDGSYVLEIVLPRPCYLVEMTLSSQAGTTRVDAFNADGSNAGAPTPVAPGNYRRLRLNGNAITRIVLRGGGETFLHELCFEHSLVTVTGSDDGGGIFIAHTDGDGTIEVEGTGITSVRVSSEDPAPIDKVCVVLPPHPTEIIRREEMNKHLVDELARWSAKGEVLEPNTTYRLKVVTKVEAESDQVLTSNQYPYKEVPGSNPKLYRLDPLKQEEYTYFRTEGPPGLTKLLKLLPPVGHPAPDNFASGVDDLTRYVRQTVPATVPPEGKPPLLPRPVYRAYDVGVEFNENYVDLLYRMARRDLGLYLYDNNNQPVRDAQGKLIVLSNRWGEAEKLTLTESEERWIKVVNDCTNGKLDEQKIPHSKTLTSAAEGQVLEADTVYEARLMPLLLHEDFATYAVATVVKGPAGTLDGWLVKDEGTNNAPSRWEVGQAGTPASNYIVQTSAISGGTNDGKHPEKPGTLLLRGDPNWTDYRLSAFLCATTNDDAMGVVFRHTDPNTYYRFSLDRERKYRRLVKVVSGAHTILAEDDFIYRQNADYQITVEAIGTLLRVYQDGALVFAVTDSAISNGRIGLYSWGNAGARFSDVRVDDFRKDAPVPYRFKFTTSQFTNFFHHLHSYQDETWLVSMPATANIPALLSQAVSPTTPPSEAEQRAYETLAAQVLGPQALQNPPEVQMTRVEQNSQSLALLIQSPEPIDWKRTTIEVSRIDRWAQTPQLPGAVKLTDVAFGEDAPNQESVTLLLREATNLTGYHIEQRQLPGPLTESGSPPALFVDDFNGADSGLLFHEEFGPNALDHYTIVDEEAPTMFQQSAWTVSGGHIVQTGNYMGGGSSEALPDKPGAIILTGPTSWANVRVSATLRSEDRDDIGIVFRYQDAQNYYRVSMSQFGNYRRLIKKVGGKVTKLWEDAVRYNQSQSYRLVIETFGDRLLAYVDDALLFSLQDRDIATGQAGLYCWRNTGAYFEALQVEALESDPILWQPSFTNMSGLEIVDEPGTIAGPSNWSANNGVLTQSSFIQNEDGVWQMLPGSAQDIAVGEDGSVWCTLMPTPGVYILSHWNGSAWAGTASNVGGVRIAVDAAGMPWVVNDAQQIFQWDGYTFQRLPGLAYDIAIGPNSRPYVVGTNAVLGGFGIYYWDGDSWQQLPGRGGLRITVGPDGNPWVVDNAQQIFVFSVDTATWQQLPGTAHDIGIAADGSTWIVGTDPGPGGFRLYRWNGIAWEEVSGLGAVGVAVGPDGNPWAVTDTESIFRWSGSFSHKPGTYVLAGNPVWRDIQISARLRPVASGALGVLFRYVDADNYYRFSMDRQGNYRRLIKKVGGKISKLWEDQVQYSVGQTYELTIRAVGGWLSVYLDGVLLHTVYDADIKRGRVGLYCHANTGARFERVLVKDYIRRVGQWTIEDNVQTGEPSQWRLRRGELAQTSSIGGGDAIAGAGTQVVAGDPAWTNYRLSARLCSDTNDAIGVIFRYVDDDNYYRLSADRKRNYRRLVKKVNGAFTKIWEEAGGFKLSESFLLTVDAVGSQLVGYLDDDRIFEVTDTAHTAGQVGLYCWANTAAHCEWVEVRHPALEASALWRDHFADSDLSGWYFEGQDALVPVSRWLTVAGALRHQPRPRLNPDQLKTIGAHALAGDRHWADVMIGVRLQPLDDGTIGLLFRYSDADHYYRFSMDSHNDHRQLVKYANGITTVLWKDGVGFVAEEIYELVVIADGGLLRGYMNSLPMFVVEDAQPLQTGQIGLYCTANMQALFSDARVYAADRAFDDWLLEEPFDVNVSGRWTFVDEVVSKHPSKWEVIQGELRQTSNIFGASSDPKKIAGPGTYALAGDTNWADYRVSIRLRSDDNDAIGLMFRHQDKDNYYRFSMDRQRRYRRLIKKVDGVVSLLWEDSIRYIRKREYLLTIDCVGERLAIYLDGGELFSWEDSSLASGGIGLYCWANIGVRFAEVRVAAPVWAPYYTFTDEPRMAAGTRVRVYSGSLKDAPSDKKPGVVERFSTSHGDRGHLRWPKDSVDLRVRAHGAVNGHARRFFPDGTYTPVDVNNLRMLRKADGTGFFLTVTPSAAGASPLTAGEYRLTMTYHRKKEPVDSATQVLSQAGNRDAEYVAIDVPWQTG